MKDDINEGLPTQAMRAQIEKDHAEWIQSSLESTLSDRDQNVLARGRIARADVQKTVLSFWPRSQGIPVQLRDAGGSFYIHHQGAIDSLIPVSVVEIREPRLSSPEIVLRRLP